MWFPFAAVLGAAGLALFVASEFREMHDAKHILKFLAIPVMGAGAWCAKIGRAVTRFYKLIDTYRNALIDKRMRSIPDFSKARDSTPDEIVEELKELQEVGLFRQFSVDRKSKTFVENAGWGDIGSTTLKQVAFSCPSCGAKNSIYTDASSNVRVCEYCGSSTSDEMSSPPINTQSKIQEASTSREPVVTAIPREQPLGVELPRQNASSDPKPNVTPQLLQDRPLNLKTGLVAIGVLLIVGIVGSLAIDRFGGSKQGVQGGTAVVLEPIFPPASQLDGRYELGRIDLDKKGKSDIEGFKNTGDIAVGEGRLHDAEAVYLAAALIAKRISGEDSIDYSNALEKLVTIYGAVAGMADLDADKATSVAWKAAQQVVPLARKAVSIREKNDVGVDETSFRLKESLADAFEVLGNKDEAAKIRTTLKQTVVAPAPAQQPVANRLVGAWACKVGDSDTTFTIARFPDGKFVHYVLVPSQKYEYLQAGSYSIDGQRYSETWKAARILRVQLHRPQPEIMEWRVSAKSDTVLHSNYKTSEYQLAMSSENQYVLRLEREVNWDGRDSTNRGMGQEIRCDRAEQLYKQLEAVRAGIPSGML